MTFLQTNLDIYASLYVPMNSTTEDSELAYTSPAKASFSMAAQNVKIVAVSVICHIFAELISICLFLCHTLIT